MKTAEHLSKKDIVNYGSFYTPDKLVKYIHKLISNNINTDILNSAYFEKFLTEAIRKKR